MVSFCYVSNHTSNNSDHNRYSLNVKNEFEGDKLCQFVLLSINDDQRFCSPFIKMSIQTLEYLKKTWTSMFRHTKHLGLCLWYRSLSHPILIYLIFIYRRGTFVIKTHSMFSIDTKPYIYNHIYTYIDSSNIHSTGENLLPH